jgi:outer membrane scaffolding protein for murein synthesis (MipA/OmpV family)
MSHIPMDGLVRVLSSILVSFGMELKYFEKAVFLKFLNFSKKLKFRRNTGISKKFEVQKIQGVKLTNTARVSFVSLDFSHWYFGIT